MIAEVISNMPDLELYGFIDKEHTSPQKYIADKGNSILGDDDMLPKIDESIFVHLCLGAELIDIRCKLIEKIKSLSLKVITIAHPSAHIAESSTVGKGTTVLVSAIINSNTKIGNHSCINTRALIEHDCVIGNNVFIQPNSTLGGSVIVDDNTVVGIGATIRDKIKIGKNCIIGGGAFVCKDIPDNTIAYGVPAKVIKTIKNIK